MHYSEIFWAFQWESLVKSSESKHKSTDENFGHIQGQVVTNRTDSVKFKTGFYWEMLELNDNFDWFK